MLSSHFNNHLERPASRALLIMVWMNFSNSQMSSSLLTGIIFCSSFICFGQSILVLARSLSLSFFVSRHAISKMKYCLELISYPLIKSSRNLFTTHLNRRRRDQARTTSTEAMRLSRVAISIVYQATKI